MESRLALLDCLGELNNATVEGYIREVRPKLTEEIAQWRKLEHERDSKRDERFE